MEAFCRRQRWTGHSNSCLRPRAISFKSWLPRARPLRTTSENTQDIRMHMHQQLQEQHRRPGRMDNILALPTDLERRLRRSLQVTLFHTAQTSRASTRTSLQGLRTKHTRRRIPPSRSRAPRSIFTTGNHRGHSRLEEARIDQELPLVRPRPRESESLLTNLP